MRVGTFVSIWLFWMSGTALAACPAGQDDPVWYLAACEISRNSARLDENLAEVRVILGPYLDEETTPDAVYGMLALEKSFEAPVTFVPEVDENYDDAMFGAAGKIETLLRRLRIDLTSDEHLNLIELQVALKDSGMVPHSALYIGWLDVIVGRRGYELLYIDWGGGASHGVAIVTPELFCRWVNVKLDDRVGLVGTWNDAVGDGLASAVVWSDIPRDDCVRA